jgi:adenylate cyclase
MAVETERKFIVKADRLEAVVRHIEPELIRQGYLCSDAERTVRVRLKGDNAFLTIKGKTSGISRQEFEYPIPVQDAKELLLLLCKGPLIEKKRYHLYLGAQLWEIDEFMGDNQGLLMAEAELEEEEQQLAIPDWVEREVTHDPRYYNARLAENPFLLWS